MSQIETCFFERYASLALAAFLGYEYEGLVNRDRPDLQTPDGKTLGIEVTRAVAQNKESAEELLFDIGGYSEPENAANDLELIRESGYGYGLKNGKYIGSKEKYYWELARPLLEILETKVSKAVSGLYGKFDRMGLFVFCKDQLSEAQAIKTYKYVMELQQYTDGGGYDFLYLSDSNDLYACNLADGLTETARL
ncbi:MAG: hypothetical protein MJY56_06710, partial [Bacteroidales bacterium]|nr:hypothetical protein [Bacteroidales bacterium]